jgi:hypothetical protein
VRLLDESGPNRVGQNVSGHDQRCLVVAKDMLEVALLPEYPTPPAAIAVRGSLFDLICEGDKVRGF